MRHSRDAAHLGQVTDVIIPMPANDASSDAVHVRTAPAQITVIDAPATGATQVAEQALLPIKVGCTQAEAAPLTAQFNAMSKHAGFLDRSDAGAAMKLAVNFLIHGLSQQCPKR